MPREAGVMGRCWSTGAATSSAPRVRLFRCRALRVLCLGELPELF